MNKRYVYRWFTGNVYNGVLNPSSDFTFTQEINTAGPSIQIVLPISFEDAEPALTFDEVVDDDGDNVADTNGNILVSDFDYLLGLIPALNDRIEVWEFSDDYPNGKLMFTGLVSKWGGSYSQNSITVSVLSYGVQLDNYLAQILPSQVLTSNDFDYIDSSDVVYSPWKSTLSRTIGIGQTFQLSGDSGVIKVSITVGNPGTQSVPIELSIVQGTPLSPGAVLGTVSRNIDPQDNIPTEFTFSTELQLLGGVTYHFQLLNDGFSPTDTQTLSVGIDSSANYASGSRYTYDDSAGWFLESDDIAFEIISSTGAVGSEFASYDPSEIMRSLLTNFQSLGGIVGYTEDSIEDTGTIVSYTFKFNTYLEAVKKVIDLSPANWYWYIDAAENILYMAQRSTEVDHRLILGNHVDDLDIEYTLENMKNKVYFSGGDDGSGANIVVYSAKDASISRYGNWLYLMSDNRVTRQDTVEILSEAQLNQDAYPKFATKVRVDADNYDITSFKIGQIVGFENFNDLVNSLELQIYSIEYTPDYCNLTLAVLPPSQARRIEDIRRNLNRQETENNPADS